MPKKPTYEELEKRVQELEQVKENLLEAKLRQQKAIKAANIGLWDWDLKANTVNYSEEWKQQIGYEDHEISNDFAEWKSRVHPEDLAQTITVVTESIARSRKNHEVEFRFRHKDGSYRWILSQGSIIQDHKGNPVRMLGSHIDITDRKMAERETLVLKTAIDQAPVGIVLADAGISIYYWNPEGLGMRGGKPGDLVEIPKEAFKNWQIYTLTGEPYEVEDLPLVRAIKKGTIIREDFIVKDQDGNDHICNAIACPVFENGRIVGGMVIFVDITERKHANEALCKSHEMLKRTEAMANIGSWEWNVQSDRTYWSEELFRLFGRDPVDGSPSFAEQSSFYANGDMQRLRDAVELCVKRGTPYEIELRAIRSDGEIRHCVSRGQPQYDENGKVYQIFGSFQDITERKLVEEQLRESEQRLTLATASAGIGTWAWDIVTDEMMWDEHIFRLYGITEIPQHYGLDYWQNCLHPDDREKSAEACMAAVRGEKEFDIEFRVQCPDGMVRWMKGNGVVIRDEGGNPLRMLGTNYDITERKVSEEVVRESEKRFATAFQYSPAPLVLSEIDTGLFIDVNDRWIEMLEFTREEQIGKTSKEVGIWDDPGERDRIIAKLRSDGRVRDEPIRFKTKSGKAIIALWSAESVNLSGQQVMLSMITDITQLRQAEEEREHLDAQLQQAQKMEAVGRLAGGIAHDFNNMLGVILGYAELALKKIDPASPIYANLHRIHEAGERSADLTRQLLAFARKQTIAPKVININDTVEGMLNMLRRLIGEDIDLLWHPGRSLQTIKIDPSQIDQLLANLCVNARDAIEGVGKITIETGAKSIDNDYCHDHLESQPGDYVMLGVSDDGCGMDKRTLSQIFEPFFTTKEKGQGIGLGLASIYGIVKQNNGFINVYSEPDQGTTFKIYLPVYGGKSAETGEKADGPPTERGNESILLVEDESAILDMTTMMLESLGYRVVAAATPGEAIRLTHEYQGRIDLLMTDVVMPEMNGQELVINLLSHYPHLKRLFMSGYTANVIAHHGVLDEGVHFIQKPFSMKDLGRKLREVLEG
ncbi:PAS domain-containing protein [Desulfopila sp. IMCC35008]|uniref:PAS domain-containing protein n=1 Tax=Desulfopila sp. IMCC35008 TaxID=2653858 RepID=UPI0013D13443|nr:PAS domain-containing protein [Desulfopila sp. IMCC35008]